MCRLGSSFISRILSSSQVGDFGYHCCSSDAPSLLSSFSAGCLAITFSNWDQRPSTWLNSLPTWNPHLVSKSFRSRSELHRERAQYRNYTLKTSVQLVDVLKHILHALLPISALCLRPEGRRVTYRRNVSDQNVSLLLEVGLLARRAICGIRHCSGHEVL